VIAPGHGRCREELEPPCPQTQQERARLTFDRISNLAQRKGSWSTEPQA
jgi:hypothetical protein